MTTVSQRVNNLLAGRGEHAVYGMCLPGMGHVFQDKRHSSPTASAGLVAVVAFVVVILVVMIVAL